MRILLYSPLRSQLSFQHSSQSMEKDNAETKVKGREKVKVTMAADEAREKELAIRTTEEAMTSRTIAGSHGRILEVLRGIS